MQPALDQFEDRFTEISELDALYTHLKTTLALPNDLSNILRAEWVQAISALDKLIHEIVRLGMIQSFLGTRVKTAKFQSFPISTATLNSIVSATIPPPQFFFEQEIVQKNKFLSFQDPDKISDALSYVWDEQHKWNIISASLGIPERDVKIKLKNIVARRNQIVHEADVDIVTGHKIRITKSDVDDVVSFIHQLGRDIFSLAQ